MGLFNRKSKIQENSVATPTTEIKNENRELVFSDTSFVSISALYPNELDVLNNSAVWSAVRYISSIISTLPLHTFKKNGKVREIDAIHPVSRALNNPNPYMTKSVFVEVMAVNLELFGVAYAEITWTENTLNKYPKMILPISPRDIQVNAVDGDLHYLYTPTGQYIPKENLIIVMGSSLNGFLPLNPIKYMKSSLELAKAGEKLQQRYFEKGTMMGGIVTVPSSFLADDKQRIKTSFDNAFTGVHNAYGTVILSDGVKYEPIKFSAEDNQLLESRNFTIQDVARRFGVSPYALGDLSHATFSNVEQQSLNDIKNTFLPRIVKFEEAFNQKLFNNKDRTNYYIKFSMEGITRGDISTRYNAYNVALQNGFLTRNEIRALEDMNPIEGADELFVPLNMVSLKTAKDYIPQGYVSVGEAVEYEPVELEPIQETVKLDEAYYLNERAKITGSSKSQIERLVRKVLKKEIDVLNSQISTIPQIGKEGFKKEYSKQVHNVAVEFENDFQAIFNDIATRLNPIIAKELNKSNLTSDAEIEAFVKNYTSTFIHRFTGKIVGDVYKTVDRATEDTLKADIEEVSNEWVMNLPSQVRDEESVRSSNAFTKTLFVAYGITKMKSVAMGDACPICRKLDGKIVSIEGSFINKDTEFNDEEGNKVHFRKNYGHPPYHKGCSCGIAPSN